MTNAHEHVSPRLLPPLLVAVASLLLWVIVPGLYRTAQPLAPYVTVLTSREHADAESALRAAGFTQIITPESTEVFVTRFSGLEAISLSQALDQLDPRDPRRDPWITSLERYFTIGDEQALYIRTQAPLWQTSLAVREALGPGSRVAEWSPARILAGGLLFLLAVLVTIVGARGLRLLLFPAVLPWVPFVAAVGVPGGTAAAAVFVATAWLAEASRRHVLAGRSLRRVRPGSLGYRGFAWTAVVVVSLVYTARIVDLRAAIAAGAAVLGSSSLLIALLLVRRAWSDPDHTPFEPVDLLPRRPFATTEHRWRLLALTLLPLLLAGPPLVDLIVPAGSAMHPVPVRIRGGLDHDSISVLWSSSSRAGNQMDDQVQSGPPGALPDVADYLAHRAYQEGLSYGMRYGFPQPGESVELLRFREEPDGSYSSFTEPVITFDDAWVAASLEQAPAGIARMLVGIGAAAGVVLSPTHTLYSGYSQLVQHLAYVVLVLAPFLLAAVRWSRPVRTRDPVLELGRRRKQVA